MRHFDANLLDGTNRPCWQMETIVNWNQVGASAVLAILLVAADYTGSLAAEKKVSHSELSVTKKTDQSSPKLYEATSKGKHFPKVSIEMSKTAPHESKVNQNVGASGKR
jgi:type VI secretion system Hcp family effector